MAECLLESGRAQEAADLTIAALAAPEHAGRQLGLSLQDFFCGVSGETIPLSINFACFDYIISFTLT
jgi:hypothetical protein